MGEVINTGDMDRMVLLKQPVKSKTKAGAPDNTYSTYDTVWAKREAMNISEELAGRRISVLEKYRYTIYYDSGVNESFRLVDDSVNYNILSVDPLKGKIFMELIL